MNDIIDIRQNTPILLRDSEKEHGAMITGQMLYWSFVALTFCVAVYNLIGKSTTRKDVFASIAAIVGLLLLVSPLFFPDSGLYTDNTVVGTGY